MNYWLPSSSYIVIGQRHKFRIWAKSGFDSEKTTMRLQHVHCSLIFFAISCNLKRFSQFEK